MNRRTLQRKNKPWYKENKKNFFHRFIQSRINMPPTSENEGEESPILNNEKKQDAQEKTYDLSSKYSLKASVQDKVSENVTAGTHSDAPSEMTYGRRIAARLSKTCCIGGMYNPSRKKEKMVIPANEEEGIKERIIEPPRLDKGWEYFEHYVLPRCFANREATEKGRTYSRAEPGEDQEKTMLYPVWGTPLQDMGDFGIGVGMYFDMLRYFGLVALIVALISTPALVFYASSEYSPDGKETIVNPVNKASAICTNTYWVPCPNCTKDDFNTWPTSLDDIPRVVNGTAPAPNQDKEVVFMLRNGCELNETFSIVTLAGMFFFCLSTLVFIFLQKRMRMKMDENEQTTSDYSIRIKNPPFNAKDPEKWKVFFETAFDDLHVTVCTVALDNEDLVAKLVARRKLLLQLENSLPLHIPFCSEDLEKTVLQCPEPNFLTRLLCCSPGPKELYDKIQAIDEEIEKWADHPYPASSVFVTFETEEMQRRVLKAMTYPKLCKGVVDSKYKFEGHVLEVTEPDEPCSIRWDDLDESKIVRVGQRVATFLLTCVLIVGGAALIAAARERDVTLSAILIVILNTITPMVVRFLASFESHIDQTSYSSSVYVKITMLRWINTAIVTAVISPFAYTLTDGEQLIESIRIIFTAELVQRPILQLTDWMGNLKRHFFAPRAKDQRRMNLLFSSYEYSIGERYTEITKLLFLTCFYATLYPAAWYFAAATLFVYYWVDKFCVLRTWKQGPKINAKISIYSVYFFLMCAITYAVMAAYNVAMFPFDNACETEESVPDYYVGEYQMRSNSTFVVSSGDKVFKYCDQDLFRYIPAAFPPLPKDQPKGSEWMSPVQMKFVPIFGWGCIGVVSFAFSIVLTRFFIGYVLPFCSRRYKTQGKAMETGFSDVREIEGYIPHVDIPGHEFPFLICDITDIDDELIGWKGYGSHKFNNLIYDMPQVLRRRKSKKNVADDNPMFSQVMHWPPSEEFEAVDNQDVKVTMGGSLRRLFFQ